jgi:hypothetical protein
MVLKYFRIYLNYKKVLYDYETYIARGFILLQAQAANF